eukprot:CAMPEP_0113317232 /NCGR_PEP_ID=MMETSP0010_2-20120614/12216_1 /TAXON_ID=216773 ORGANISM="Corethron hystrix, Strain 308" /NCGR_SAMPLE_ID=MMETSP0010_2 /ASSEMBLY_ACC=CAM_ASM_000155 /LENGTH=434 /DNA_ID=CAMNT_0000174159 /DNA_START=41 /DNA_END=1345 /DNA_ORIENTATION=+ /assembly_acc=CAM_ASM_000155
MMLKSLVLTALVKEGGSMSFHGGGIFPTIDTTGSIKADSGLGMKILARARRVEDADSSYSYYDTNIDYSYIAGYSLKFQGCHSVSMWNGNDQNQNERKLQDYSAKVFISSKPLVEFRLCPTTSCSDSNSKGCASGYGDYVVDLNQYLEAYLENKQEVEAKLCDDVYSYDKCGCQNGNADDMDACLYNCYMSFGYDFCLENGDQETNNYMNGEYYTNEYNSVSMDIMDYIECTSFDFTEVNQNINRYSNSYNPTMWYDVYNQAIEYYVGPTCTSQGGDVRLGVFTDASCTVKSPYSFNTLSGGYKLPYSDQPLIGSECVKCKYEEYEYNNGNGNGYYDNGDVNTDQVSDFCRAAYSMSGKCEKKMNIYYPNVNGCSYIAGLKLTKEDGIIRTSSTRTSKIASGVITLLISVSSILGMYVYYLQSKLSGPKINLNE